MDRNEEKKPQKVPRNFRLEPTIEAELRKRGLTFKGGNRIGDTGVVESALELYFARHPNPSSETDDPNHEKTEGKGAFYLKGKFRRKK